MCSACARVTTSGWRAFGSAVSKSIELQGDLAKVSFVVQSDQQVLGTTVASVTYQNIVGQRYLGLSLGKLGEPGPLPPDSVIPVERTDPSFDVGTLLNGYEPLFSLLNPRDADNLTKGVVQSLQGDTGSITALVDQTSQLTESFAGRDEELGAVITDLNTVVANLARHNDDLDHVITETRSVVSTFDARRPELVASTGSIAKVVRQLSTISDEVYPSLNELVTREPGFASAHGRHRAAAGVHRGQSAATAWSDHIIVVRPCHCGQTIHWKLDDVIGSDHVIIHYIAACRSFQGDVKISVRHRLTFSDKLLQRT